MHAIAVNPRAARPPLRRMLSLVLQTVHNSPVNTERLAAETDLLLQIRNLRDGAAFDSLFAMLSGKIYGYLVHTGSCTPADGENLLQEIWLAVWTKATLFEPTRASARTWIFAMARHALIDFKRAATREHRAYEQYFFENEDSFIVDDNHAERSDGDKTAALLEQLPPEQTQVLLMAYVEGKSHRDIARELGLPVGTVKSRLRLGFSRVRALLEGPP